MNTSARKKKTHGTSAVVRTFVVVLALLLCLTGLMPLLGAASDSEAEQTVIPVSYTHLDVYKRQATYRAFATP